ncbi:MAG: prolyl oligopeptidase family serine peptidase [Longimicrobiales bacterium]
MSRAPAPAPARALARALVLALVAALATLATAPARAHAQDPDPFLWLEEVEAPRALEWVEARNAETLAELSRHPGYEPIYERALEIMNSDDRIDYPSILGERIYNFWQDETHERGIWRRTSWDAYLGGEPDWQTVIDLDALSAAEGVTWAWSGATCLPPTYTRCLVRLSRGGADAVEIREFDASTLRFITRDDGGFFLPEAKQGATWLNQDALLVATAHGPVTSSGYARTAQLWRRGTPLQQASTLFEGDTTDVSVGVYVARTADAVYPIVIHRPEFFEGTSYLLRDDETLVELELPDDADMDLVRDQLVVYLRSPWTVGGATHEAGTLIATRFDDFLAGGRDFDVIVDPGERQTIRGTSATRDHLLVTMLDNVRAELRRYTHEDGRWTFETVPAPDFGDVGVVATSPVTNRYFFTFDGFTQPTTLYLGGEGGPGDCAPVVRRMPEVFDASGLVVEQHETTSRDGTRVPYFVVRPRELRSDGTNPTLLYAYGGFEIAQTPGYSAIVGAAWLERGGVYVVANIRGGGEFGPDWHRAGLKENRQVVYDDFIAVAEDLIERGITSPRHLGISGGSNGGLLVGVALTQRPELFNAVVVRVPLLDMLRYHRLLAGASWIAEYGNPDIAEERAFIARYSPYQNVRADQPYPRVFFTTTTRDDRVHPGHARKMAAKMASLGYPIYYYENTEGGHGAGVTNEQRARVTALTYAYLWERLARQGLSQ